MTLERESPPGDRGDIASGWDDATESIGEAIPSHVVITQDELTLSDWQLRRRVGTDRLPEQVLLLRRPSSGRDGLYLSKHGLDLALRRDRAKRLSGPAAIYVLRVELVEVVVLDGGDTP